MMLFDARVRDVGGISKKRPALGVTIPKKVCQELKLKKGDRIKVVIIEG